MKIEKAKEIMGENFIGSDKLSSIASKSHIACPIVEPEINFSEELLNSHKNDSILILGVKVDDKGRPLTINQFRENFGVDPQQSEPCMYNQDWYLNEDFASKKTLENRWYLISKSLSDESRGLSPKEIKEISGESKLPLAVLTTFAFFVQYFLTQEMLWKNDFLWCEDKDKNGDQIYTGRYIDPNGINKNGFNIHRHLSIKKNYGVAYQYFV